mmetsp:Transcript_33779/g.71016  ORF Transcript_33779/g.71016 Transcript_33779/m.71016 type:complete len:420 (-) Transcript_33779:141-1400(-)
MATMLVCHSTNNSTPRTTMTLMTMMTQRHHSEATLIPAGDPPPKILLIMVPTSRENDRPIHHQILNGYRNDIIPIPKHPKRRPMALPMEDLGEEEEGEEGEDEYLGVGEEVMTKLRNSHRPVIVVVNKVDLAAREEEEEEGGGETTKGDGGQRKRKSGNTNGNNNDAYANTPSLAVQTISKWRATLPDAFAILPACAADGPNDPGVSALRAILTANDPNVDVASSIRRLGRPVPGMFGPTATAAPVIVTNREAREILPLGPPLYHPDFFTDRTDRFCASESIRETLFTKLGKELPYCCEVRVETFDESRRYLEEEDDDDGSDGEGNGNSSGSTNNNNTKKRKRKQKPLIKIGATILVERDSQVGIVVGKGGQKIKEVGMESREKLRALFEVEVMLELRVKVDKNWRNDVEKLKRYGYAG